MFVFLSYWKDFVGTEKRVRIIHGKRAIAVRAIEIILYVVSAYTTPHLSRLVLPTKSRTPGVTGLDALKHYLAECSFLQKHTVSFHNAR